MNIYYLIFSYKTLAPKLAIHDIPFYQHTDKNQSILVFLGYYSPKLSMVKVLSSGKEYCYITYIFICYPNSECNANTKLTISSTLIKYH